MKLSSHKNEATIKEYSVKCPDSKKCEMCDSLSNAILPKHIKKASPTCTVSVNPDTNTIDINDVTQNLPTFDLELMENFDTMDDSELVNLIYETEQQDQNENKTDNNDKQIVTVLDPKVPNRQNIAIPLQAKNQNQINTQNVTNKYPILPQMYFPNSSVTINYNFGKQ